MRIAIVSSLSESNTHDNGKLGGNEGTIETEDQYTD